jgi:hypothetical protein
MDDMNNETGAVSFPHHQQTGIDFPLQGENRDTFPTIGRILTLFRDILSGVGNTRPTLRGDKLNGN